MRPSDIPNTLRIKNRCGELLNFGGLGTIKPYAEQTLTLSALAPHLKARAYQAVLGAQRSRLIKVLDGALPVSKEDEENFRVGAKTKDNLAPGNPKRDRTFTEASGVQQDTADNTVPREGAAPAKPKKTKAAKKKAPKVEETPVEETKVEETKVEEPANAPTPVPEDTPAASEDAPESAENPGSAETPKTSGVADLSDL